MPQIKEYTAENDALRPTEAGVEAFAQSGRRIGAFYNQAGEALRRSSEDRARAAEAQARAAGALATEEKAKFSAYGDVAKATGTAVQQAETFASNQEIGHAAASFTQATQGWGQKWQDTIDAQIKADPNNISIQKGFLGQFEPWAQNFVSGFHTPGGQDWANEQVNHLRNHLFEKTTADMSTMAGIAASTNADKSKTAWMNDVRMDPSPHNVDFLVGTDGKPGQIDRIADAIISTNPYMKGVDAYRFKTQWVDEAKRDVVHAGALGAIDKSNGSEAVVDDYSKRYAQYMDPIKDDFSKAARTYRRAAEQDQDRAERKAQDAIDDRSRQELDDLTKKIYGGDSVSKKDDILNNKFLNAADRKHAIDYYNKEDNLPPTESHRNLINLIDDIRSGRVTKDGQILDRMKDFNRVDLEYGRKELANTKTPEGEHLGYLKKQLTDSVKSRLSEFQTAKNDAQYRWQFALETKYNKLEAEHRGGGMAVFDPDSPEYMGSTNALRPFMSPIQQRISGAGGVGSPLPATFGDRFQAAGPSAPAAKLYNGKWYVRGPNGESVEAK